VQINLKGVLPCENRGDLIGGIETLASLGPPKA